VRLCESGNYSCKLLDEISRRSTEIVVYAVGSVKPRLRTPATTSNEFIVKFRPFEVEHCFDIVAGVDGAFNSHTAQRCLFIRHTASPIGVRSIAISVSVYMSVCLSVRLRISKIVQISPLFLLHVTCGRARSYSDGNAICYALPIL